MVLEDGRVRQAAVGASSIALSPHFIGCSLRWRAIVEWRNYEGQYGYILALVRSASMLLGGDSFRRSVAVSWPASCIIFRIIQVVSSCCSSL